MKTFIAKLVAAFQPVGHKFGEERGDAGIGFLVSIVLFVIIASALLPTAIQGIFDVDITDWGAAGNLWVALPVIVIAVVLFRMYKKADID